MEHIYNKEQAGNEIAKYVRECAEEGYCEVTKDDFISFKAKAGRRLRFCIQCNGIIIEAKEISLVNDHHNIKTEWSEEYECELLKADEIRYSYMFLDKTSINLDVFEWGRDTLSIEIVGC